MQRSKFLAPQRVAKGIQWLALRAQRRGNLAKLLQRFTKRKSEKKRIKSSKRVPRVVHRLGLIVDF